MPALERAPDVMTTTAVPAAPVKETGFQTGRALPILVGHFVHDTFTAAVAPLLPMLIDKLSLSLTAAGALSGLAMLAFRRWGRGDEDLLQRQSRQAEQCRSTKGQAHPLPLPEIDD